MTRQEIDELLSQRSEAKRTGNYHLADILRGNLAKNGVTITDTPDGQVANGGTEYELRQALSALEQCKQHIKTLEDRAEVDRKSRAIERAHMTRTVYRLTAAEALLHQAMPFAEAPLCEKIKAHLEDGTKREVPEGWRVVHLRSLVKVGDDPVLRAMSDEELTSYFEDSLKTLQSELDKFREALNEYRPNPVNAPQTRADADS